MSSKELDGIEQGQIAVLGALRIIAGRRQVLYVWVFVNLNLKIEYLYRTRRVSGWKLDLALGHLDDERSTRRVLRAKRREISVVIPHFLVILSPSRFVISHEICAITKVGIDNSRSHARFQALSRCMLMRSHFVSISNCCQVGASRLFPTDHNHPSSPIPS